MPIAASTIYRLRPSVAVGEPDATKVEHGAGYLFTHEGINSLIWRVADAARFIRLTTRTGPAVYLSVGAIAAVRPALPRNVPGTEIVVSGQYQHGMETVSQVEALLG